MSNANDIRDRITEEIANAIESGVLPWRKPWKSSPNAGSPKNVVSKKSYRGVNPLVLELASMKHGFSSRWWGTFKQWEGLGGKVMKRPSNVRSGCWGTKVIFYQPVVVKKEISKDGDEWERRFMLLREYTVFNADQVNGLDHLKANYTSTEESTVPNYDEADMVIDATKADIRYGGDRAFYRPSADYIQMPPRCRFVGGEFYETIFHELAHWSEKRLDWTGSYALNELIAEIASCFVAAEVGVPVIERLDNHAAYIANWLEALEDDPRMIFQAASQASKVSDFILSFSRPQEELPIKEVEEAVEV